MNWEDHKDNFSGSAGRPGGDWRGIRPSLENPATWSVPFLRIARISCRVHIVFLLYIIIELVRSLVPPSTSNVAPLGFAMTAMMLGALFVVVLIHEFGHCLACRWAGGSADEILMWPLGGLAYCQPPHRWKAHLLTVVGGPIVNVLICLVCLATLVLITGQWRPAAIPNPFDPSEVAWVLGSPQSHVSGSWWLLAVYWLHLTSLVLLLFNLLPMFPLDGGRILQCALWPAFGYSISMRFSVYAGYIGAILLGIFGIVTERWMLVGVAIFGGLTCWMTIRQLRFTDEFMGFEYESAAESYSREEPARVTWRERRRQKLAERRRQTEEAETRQMDDILQKISERGIESLSPGERRILQRVTERKQRSSR